MIFFTNFFLYIRQLWISRASFDPWDNRKLFGLINLCELRCASFRHSAGLHARVTFDGAACRLGDLETFMMYWCFWSWSCCTDCAACSCVAKEEWMRKMSCSWWKPDEIATVDVTCNTPDDSTCFTSKKMTMQFLSRARPWAKRVVCAFRACEHTVLNTCVLWVGVLSTPPVDFLEFLPRNRNCATKLKLNRLPAGFPVALCQMSVLHCKALLQCYGKLWSLSKRQSRPVTILANIVLCQRISVSFLCIPSCENRRMAPMCVLPCLLKHLLRLEKHSVFSDAPCLSDKAKDWSKVEIRLLDRCRIPLALQISSATATNDPDFCKGIAIRRSTS